MPHLFMTGGSLQSLPPGSTVLRMPFRELDLIQAAAAAAEAPSTT